MKYEPSEEHTQTEKRQRNGVFVSKHIFSTGGF